MPAGGRRAMGRLVGESRCSTCRGPRRLVGWVEDWRKRMRRRRPTRQWHRKAPGCEGAGGTLRSLGVQLGRSSKAPASRLYRQQLLYDSRHATQVGWRCGTGTGDCVATAIQVLGVSRRAGILDLPLLAGANAGDDEGCHFLSPRCDALPDASPDLH
jgi:hypothetical protein